MNALHLEDQVSFDFSFDDTKVQLLHSNGDTTPLVSHQAASGLEPGEFTKRKKDAWNQLNLQRNLASFFGSYSMAFRPSDTVLKAILSVYQHNSVCSVLNDRLRLDETPALRLPVDCSLEVDHSEHTTPIFTKHPRTGKIARHLYPYATLPRFSLPSMDPGLLGVAAYIFDRDTEDHRDPCPLDIEQRFRDLWDTHEIIEHCAVFYKQLPTPPSSPPDSFRGESPVSHKRKHADDGQARPIKRSRIAVPSRHITPRQRPRRVDPKRATGSNSPHASTTPDVAPSLVIKPPSPLKRKRAASVQDCPVQQASTTKRPRKDLPAATIPTRTVYERAVKGRGRRLT
ncbi:hypothetical protein CYLTODRAFT_489435 [Cylindrobasidium torrendii FP15055 ss-10]|uniref:Uncharacterized protein n=1 Tax=Cylindrobasidium torrendii FP15055 ss-10 TaxID=1314674 RepID=A0A0D7BFA9_9AGAR|nr:hypothetical protein CYLTODRAFT_489435 [Cylindrobasidium torrendii FP15055 ss-10]